jgi:multicomponent Na+:H+ antiporter subunit G
MDNVLAVLTALSLLAGAGFALVGALGVIRFPDVYTRMHAASKAGTLGSGFCLVAVALSFGEVDVATRAVVAVVFFMLTAPVSAHLLARAAFKAGYPSGCVENAYLAEVDREAASQQDAAGEEDRAG